MLPLAASIAKSAASLSTGVLGAAGAAAVPAVTVSLWVVIGASVMAVVVSLPVLSFSVVLLLLQAWAMPMTANSKANFTFFIICVFKINMYHANQIVRQRVTIIHCRT